MEISNSHTKTTGENLVTKGVDTIVAHMEMNEECKSAFQELKLRKKYRYIIYSMGSEYFQIEHLGEKFEDFDSFRRKLPYTDCRFCIYDHEYKSADGRSVSKIWFISWFPNNSTPYHKMAYTTSKSHFHENLSGVFDMQASSVEDLEAVLGPPKVEVEDEDFDF